MANQSTSTSASPSERSQYHHFIPRFILRNYSHPGEAPVSGGSSQKRNKRRNRSQSIEPMLYGINLAGETPEITETTVAKTFGMVDMYRDASVPTKQHHIEKQLSVLESQAGEVISTIRKAFEAGKTEAWITRTQRDTLRKFLFIMKYRGSTFHKRYCHDNADDYNSNDRETMLKYMKEKKIDKPIDVWFDNIKGILDLKMDCGLQWMERLTKRIYPDDAQWFINNVQQFYMALVTPTNPDEEFLLTQNAYSIHEGAETEEFNPVTGKMECTAYTEFHVFAPIAPRLLIVLRTFLLPIPEEDFNDSTREWREACLKTCTDPHIDPEAAGQYLRDLPIRKALNSYTKMVDGGYVSIRTGPPKANDRFGFRFFPLSEEHVNKINTIMLEQSHGIDLIVFNNKAATYKTLQYYLSTRIGFESNIERAKCRWKLRKAADLLAPAEAHMPSQAVPEEMPGLSSLGFPEDKLFALFQTEEKARKLYFELGGQTLAVKDFDQARGLQYMRVKLETLSRGLSEEVREAERTKFLVLYGQFPVQVIWIYLKRLRFMKLYFSRIGRSNVIEDDELPPEYLYGPEDVIAASRNLFRKDAFCRIMHHASMNGFLLAKPTWGLASELTPDGRRLLYELTNDEDGFRRLQEEVMLVLGDQGSICDCGIPCVEAAAKDLRRIIRANVQRFWKCNLDIFDEEEKIEILTRDLIRVYGDRGTGERLIEDLELENVLFNVVYPSFGSRLGQVSEGSLKPTLEDQELETEVQVLEGDEAVKEDKFVKTDAGWTCLVQ